MDKDTEIFKGKSFSDIQKIYTVHLRKKNHK